MTLKIQKASLNKLAVTLNELANEANPNNWLFRFVFDQGSNEYENVLYMSDLASVDQQARYNLFHLTEPADTEFIKTGDYHYYVYQMPDGGSLDYDEGFLVEQGKAIIEGTETTTPAFEPNTNVKSYGAEE